jgi:hypothetical protein
MTARNGRPSFYEGQIVSAAQLNGVVDHGRSAIARHERYLHIWGIAAGLELVAVDRDDEGTAYKEIMLKPGLAVDATGRQLLLSEPERLSESKFDQQNVAINDPEAYYPVFVAGRDAADADSGSGSRDAAPNFACEAGGASLITEHVELVFGRMEDGADPPKTEAVDVDSGPGGELGLSSRVLVGFVKWDGANKHFVDGVDSHDGVGRVYAGVRADDVTSRSGEVTLRTAPKGENGAAALAVDKADGGELRFGMQNSRGEVIPVFTVNGKGDVHAEGRITGAIAGGVQVQSGVAFDGATLPLPSGFTEDQIDSGDVTIQTHVTPHWGEPALPSLPAGERWLMHPLECRVDGRRVLCRVRWQSTDGTGGSPIELPGACDFTLLAFAREE